MIHDAHAGYYECHITLEARYKEQVEPIAKECGFKVSALKGDEFLGDDIKIYLTSHAKEEMPMRGKMASMTAGLWNAKIPYIRRKIEHIIFDERQREQNTQ